MHIGIRSVSFVLIVAPLLVLASVGFAQSPEPADFDSSMSRVEQAKQKADWQTGEKYARLALKFRFTEYAGSTLVWLLGHEAKYDEALTEARRMISRAGKTAGTMGGYAEVALWAGDIDLANSVLKEAEKLGLQNGDDWRNKNIVEDRKQVNEAKSPSIYELNWKIPNADFPESGRKRFLFPGMDHPSQKFTFTLEGAEKYQVIHNPDWTLVDIWPQTGKDVLVHGRAVIYPQVISSAKIVQMEQIPLSAAPPEKTTALYYYQERIDPAYGPCVELAKSLRKPSAVDTMQAILNWRGANITYDNPPPGNTLETVLASHKGVCHHSAYLAACLARADGIPAYVVGGFVLPGKLGEFKDAEGSHGWGEVELPVVGRVAYESQNPTSLRSFIYRKTYLRYGGQDFTRPWSELPDLKDSVSLQGYKVSGSRLQ